VSSGDDIREPDQLVGVPLPEHRRHLFGHEAARARLAEQIETRRLPGGILIHGPRGIGKATLAFHMARQIFAATGDENPERVDEQVAAGGHPNLFVLRRLPRETRGFYTVIRVEEMRAMREDIRMTRGRTGHRVAIIDAVDDCNASSANALLKILEEPPPETLFLLISHRPGQLLPTIRSRCQSLALRPLAADDVASVLRADVPAVEPGALARAVELAHGRPRRGFEALAMGEGSGLTTLASWLADPVGAGVGTELALADALAANPDSAEASFARDAILDWIAAEARQAALGEAGGWRHLASANELWDKANTLFSEADSLNLDARQTLVSILDAIRAHRQHFAPRTAPERA
jgi:DNA polymerase-3 subunit delta'